MFKPIACILKLSSIAIIKKRTKLVFLKESAHKVNIGNPSAIRLEKMTSTCIHRYHFGTRSLKILSTSLVVSVFFFSHHGFHANTAVGSRSTIHVPNQQVKRPSPENTPAGLEPAPRAPINSRSGSLSCGRPSAARRAWNIQEAAARGRRSEDVHVHNPATASTAGAVCRRGFTRGRRSATGWEGRFRYTIYPVYEVRLRCCRWRASLRGDDATPGRSPFIFERSGIPFVDGWESDWGSDSVLRANYFLGSLVWGI